MSDQHDSRLVILKDRLVLIKDCLRKNLPKILIPKILVPNFLNNLSLRTLVIIISIFEFIVTIIGVVILYYFDNELRKSLFFTNIFLFMYVLIQPVSLLSCIISLPGMIFINRYILLPWLIWKVIGIFMLLCNMIISADDLCFECNEDLRNIFWFILITGTIYLELVVLINYNNLKINTIYTLSPPEAVTHDITQPSTSEAHNNRKGIQPVTNPYVDTKIELETKFPYFKISFFNL